MELNRNADNYFAEIEQAAFSPSNVVPGIGHSPDKMLQARVFSYADAHRYRLGTHYEALPVNQPKCPVHNYHKDGQMNFFGQKSGNVDAYYEPNSFSGAVEQPSAKEPPLKLSGDADRYNHRIGNDDYGQVTALVQPVRCRSALAPVLQHRCGDGWRAGGNHRAPAGAFPACPSGIRGRCSRCLEGSARL